MRHFASIAKPLNWKNEAFCKHSKTTKLGKGGTLHACKTATLRKEGILRACKDTGRLTATQYQAVLNDFEKKSGERYERMVLKPN